MSSVEMVPVPIYAAGASISARSAMWRKLREDGWQITSTWIDEAGEGETADLGELWRRITQEIFQAKGLILYAEKNDFPLKGALLEAGIAIGMGKPVIVVLPCITLEQPSCRPIGSWIRHPLVRQGTSLRHAHGLIRGYWEMVHG